MKLIAAVDQNWAIGKNGRLLVKIPKDQRLFMEETMGKTLIMGRKTFEDLPGGQPLYGRRHIVLSRDPNFAPRHVTVCRSEREALELLQGIPDAELCLCGGEEVYRLFLPYCSTADITRVDYSYDGDRFLENLDHSAEWELTMESEEESYFDLTFTFRHYERIAGGKSRMAAV